MPAPIKAACHPNLYANGGIIAGATNAPTLAPELKMLVANALSRFGNQRAAALIAEGKFPDSPKPSSDRAVRNPVQLPTSACAAAATLHAAMDTVYPIFVPNRSTNQPKPSKPMP